MQSTCVVYAGIFKHRKNVPKYEKLMVALCVCTRHILWLGYPTIYRHMTSYVGIWWDIRVKVYDEYIHIMPPLIFHTWGHFSGVWICQHTQHMWTACYAGFKSNKNTVQTRLCIYLSYDAIYLSQPGVSCHPPAIYSIVIFIPLGKFLMLESAWMHIPYT